MEISFWGTRGSIAAPGPETLSFGGNTSCCELEVDGQIFVFDAGTGIRPLGRRLLERHPGGATANLFISHSHWDHIQGFPFFAPLFVRGFSLNVFGPQEQHQRLSDTLAGQMQYRYFPVDLDDLSAAIRYQEMREERLKLGQVLITSRYLNHTALAMAYRVECGKRTLVYATDTEPYGQCSRGWKDAESRQFIHPSDDEFAHFCSGADLLIIDSQYSTQEYPSKVGWGHSTFDYCLDIAISANVKRLAFYHHDPARSDQALQAEVALAQARARADGSNVEIFAAAEGTTVQIPDLKGPEGTSDIAPMPIFRQQIHVGLVGVDQTVESLARRALTLTHFKFALFGPSANITKREMTDFHPDLILIEPEQGGDTNHIAQLVTSSRNHRRVPVLAVLPDADTNGRAVYQAFDEGASDVIVKPFTASQLRSRVDSWLFRGGVAVDRRVHPRKAAGATSKT